MLVSWKHTYANRARNHANVVSKPTASGVRRLRTALLFCIACLALNVAGSCIVAALGLPLYLDCTGIILAGAMGGIVPGVVVGFFTNMLTGLFDSSSWYYAFTSVLIGLAAADLGRRGWFERLGTSLLSVFVFALIGGGVGSVITWCLYGFSFGEGVTEPLV